MTKKRKDIIVTTITNEKPYEIDIRDANKFNRAKVIHSKKTFEFDKFSVINTPSSKQPSLQTFEKFSLIRLKALEYYLTDMLETQNISNIEELKWFRLNHKRIVSLLNLRKDTFANTEYLFTKMTYKQLQKNMIIGRLYAERFYSIEFLLRELRGVLITRKEYRDFDIVNAHPCLFLESAILLLKTIF